MKQNRILLFILLCLILLQGSKGSAVSDEDNESCQGSQQLEEQCGPYAYTIVKPMMAYFDQVTQRIDKYNAEMEKWIEKINELEKEKANSFKDHSIKFLEDKSEELIKSLQQQIDNLAKTNEKQTEQIIKFENDLKNNKEKVIQLESEVQTTVNYSKEFEYLKQQLNLISNSIEKQNKVKQTEKIVNNKTRYAKDLKNNNEKDLEVQKAEQIDSLNHLTNLMKVEEEAGKEIEYKEQLKSQQEKVLSKDKNILQLETELKKLNHQLNEIEKEKKSCISRDSSGVHKITLSNDTTFEVLCNSEIAGPGWTVIQQRINGKVEFQRDWNTYRNGFGDFWDGDFFLGLEKIHRLTTEQPHELYFHMQRFNGSSYYARYDEFAISGADDQYQISKLGTFSGNTSDEFRYHNNMKFSTYDHDNDGSFTNCASEIYGGWWYNDCVLCNMNGKYIQSEEQHYHSMQWEEVLSLKQVRMMIRPKAYMFFKTTNNYKLCA